MSPTDDLTRALALRNPVPAHDVRAVTGRGHRELSRAWTGDAGTGGAALTGVTGAVYPPSLEEERGAGPREVVAARRGPAGRRTGVVLMAACVAALVAATSFVGSGGVQGVRDRVAVAGLPEVPVPDRAAERERHGSWVTRVVDCLVDEYDPWVSATDGGYVYDDVTRFARSGPGTEPVSELACREQAGTQPRPAPITPAEARAHLADLRDTARCLGAQGFEVTPAPQLRTFYASFQQALPDRPPWTPFALVPDEELLEATDRCGHPVPPSPPVWQASSPTVLDRTFSPAHDPGSRAAAVEFTGVADSLLTTVPCLAALGVPAELADVGFVLGAEADDEDLQQANSVCGDRYPAHPRFVAPLDEGQRAELYEYYLEESVPCLAAQGVALDPAPRMFEFVRDYPQTWRPYASVPMLGLRLTAADGTEVQGEAAWDVLREACPEAPPDELLFGDG